MTPRMPSSDEGRDAGADPRTHDTTARRHDDTQVRTMELRELLSLGERVSRGGAAIPCREHDPELWFAERPADVECAKALCGLCPARAQCLAGALEREEPWGVWGGQLLVHGAIVARKRPRGRPRKHPAAA